MVVAALSIGVVGDDPVISRVLGLLLGGAGHEARAVDGAEVLGAPGASLAGADLVLLAPGLGDEREVEILNAMQGDPETAALPVLKFSALLAGVPDERSGSVPWPWSVEALERAIELAIGPDPLSPDGQAP